VVGRIRDGSSAPGATLEEIELQIVRSAAAAGTQTNASDIRPDMVNGNIQPSEQVVAVPG
jgi:hypothetical protein